MSMNYFVDFTGERKTAHIRKTALAQRKIRTSRLDFDLEHLPALVPYVWIKRKRSHKEAPKKPEISLHNITMFISDLLHIPSLLNDTAAIMKTFTKSSGVFIYIVDTFTNQIYLCPRVFDNLDETNRVTWNIKTGSTIPAYVALTKETVIVNNMKIPEKFNAYDWKDMTVTGVLCVPIVISDGSCFGVIELYRRNGINYDKRDMKKIIILSQLIATAIDNKVCRHNLQTKRTLFNYLLAITKSYIIAPHHLQILINDIVDLAKAALNSERGTYFEHDHLNHRLLAYEFRRDNDKVNRSQRRKQKSQVNKEGGIAKIALITGNLTNIKDVNNDPRFVHKKNNKTGLKIRNVLCVPVRKDNETLGVLQVVNKRTGFYSAADEKIIEIFGLFCSIAVLFKEKYETFFPAKTRAAIYRDCYFSLILNTKSKPSYEIKIEANALPKDFYQYSFYSTKEDDLIMYACWIFRTLQIPDENCTNFVFTVHRCYRNNPYHNFEHAFNVLHTVACLINGDPRKFHYLERVGLFISALCHDVDHRGVSNYYLEIIESPIVLLYDESPLEHHHLFMTMLILNQSSIKNKFSKADYKLLSEYIKEMILATDLTRHFQERPQYRLLCHDIQEYGEEIWFENLVNRRYVRNLIMTAADLSSVANSFHVVKRILKNLMAEFFEEGECMKQHGYKPLPLMDIQYIDQLPEGQIKFLNIVCIPCFELLKLILPYTNDLYEGTVNLLGLWEELIKVRDSKK